MLLKDGVRYVPHNYKNEVELEKHFGDHYREIFGEKSLFFPVKKSIKSRTGEKSIPDGYLIDFNRQSFYLIEIELSSHPEYDHISKQIGKFIRALKRSKTRQGIAGVLKDYVRKDKMEEAFVKENIGRSDIFQYFLEEILGRAMDQEYETVIVIDEKTKEIEEACSVLTPRPKIVTFKTYERENVGLDVHVHQFELLEHKGKTIRRPRKRKAKLRALPQDAYRRPILRALIENEGKGRTKDILQRVYELMKDELKKDDLKTSSSLSEPRWRNRARWERQNMIRDGLLKADSPKGIWEITKKGEKIYKPSSKMQK